MEVEPDALVGWFFAVYITSKIFTLTVDSFVLLFGQSSIRDNSDKMFREIRVLINSQMLYFCHA